MKCLVINLDRSTDRLDQVTSEFAGIGVAFERIAAVDASTGALNFPTARHLTKPEIACFLSHRKCWQIIADGTDQYSAIFEDDVVFRRDAGPFLSNDNWVPPDADIVKLETFFGQVRLARLASIGNGHSIGRLVGEHLGTAGYVISKTAAQKLLQRTKHLKEPVDLALFSPNSMMCARNTTYQVTPALCAQHQFLSGRNTTPTLIQTAPHRPKSVATKIRGELSRLFAHCRNGTFWRTQRVDLSLGWRTDARPPGRSS
ncbi:glycosyltransferase family 25 protein [Mesorhizobium sp. M2D.F.Ca.ET.185.01.1.1]|uniref:glycosyltransferase family 25 protein n=1 Tax=unclassified Mesorhizobium TaxID=325217 RepID=UPI000FCB2BA8|nr:MULTISPECIES: glycosyltransferase family 25 protein [unclassified Mesorhizobium]TGP77036.1 glycosyltransferase family 25 protein [bacterium M00.F.Ca.ET.227.01.1.1]TGP84839.1 glycosyltransferase family 25 protein [bacterium M00.F.Ca.ET.221.01.1.1]TGP88409.1 glycosyltransferase family 25 protein [bacterium M00.F.Ca.ET.222.01.1.1]TGU03170.1 glycosyltransferase family 25 protein [bacterium M00.F.Ca.ET.163.01.1.1]TGU30782.1 glycosyltransferase family 25 protein [bacterium M00.F.Ca.ET.156.01.1.1]